MSEQVQREKSEHYNWVALQINIDQPALQINVEDNDSNELAQIYHQQSTMLHEQQSLIQVVLPSLLASQPDTKRDDSRKEGAESLYQKGVDAQQKEAWDLAKNYYKQALEICRDYETSKNINDQDEKDQLKTDLIEIELKIYDNLEEIYKKNNEYNYVIDIILESIKLYIKLENAISLEKKLITLKNLYDPKNILDEVTRQKVVKFIITNYYNIKDVSDGILEEIALDESERVIYTIIQAISTESEDLDSDIRALHTKLINQLITIQIIKGGGMLIGKENDLVIRVTNHAAIALSTIQIELYPSVEYILISNKQSISTLDADSSCDISFRIIPRLAQQVAVNYRVNNGEMREPALYIIGIQDNPYTYGPPVNESITFIGRQSELEELLQAVTKPAKQDILLVGERRMGKTSLLYKLQQSLKNPFVPIYINLSECYPNTDSILNHILDKIIGTLIEKHILGDTWRTYHSIYSDFTDRVYEILQVAGKTLADIHLILLLDEADFLLKVQEKNDMTYLMQLFSKPIIDESIQRFLRAALQSSKIGARLRATVAGTTDLSTYVLQRSSPFFNHFRFVPLKPLTKSETIDLIVKPAGMLGLSYSSEAIQRICYLSGEHPYYCQALCYEAFFYASQHKHTLIDDQAIAVAEKKIRTDLSHAYFVDFWQRATPGERKILVALAREKPLNNLKTIQIKRLLNWQLLVKQQDTYRFSSGLFKQWTIMTTGKNVSNE